MHGTEESLEQKSFAQLRPLVVSSEILAAVVCSIVLLVADVSQGISPWLYSYGLVAGVVCYLTYRARTTYSLWLSGMLLVCTCTACLGSLAIAIGNPLLWFLPIGLVFSLPVSAMHAQPWHALSTGAAVWATLFYVVQPSFDRQLDLTLTLMLITASLLVATMVCLTLCRIRKNVFDLQRQLHDMAYRDTLTGLPNRRAFMEQLTATVSDETTPLFFLMLDIDDFKKINDSHGHDTGDRVLVAVAKVLSEQSQGHNFARLGGEEFAVAAQLADVAAAQQLAQRIVSAVNSNQMHGFSLSLSIGLAAHEAGESMFSLMRRADLALYDAKHAGKNRYAMAGLSQQA
ncbi:GGDEF domain-containing protein [Pseudomonas sp. GV071]|uniref:GGDEF domain-containing protein n=1 Tax=Pseudomonas sp. GV071 TaxID=2135754 RepID=UPI000D3D02C4|nr:GGDEF domain-containing protein [Pseudomonas sp. GV071]PTQ70614.1 diguanylate cyclase (GGDEF)-like protein [Pseudomonas sp. GV071]